MNLRRINTTSHSSVKLDIRPSTTIYDACALAILQRNAIKSQVEFDFNGIIINTNRHSTKQDLIDLYFTKVNERELKKTYITTNR